MKSSARATSVIESLENRQMLFASVPANYTLIGIAHIHPKSGTTQTVLTLGQGTTYFLRASGEAVNTNHGFEEDAAFKPGTTSVTTGLSTTIPPVASTGLSTTVGSTTTDSTGWGTTFQSDHIYGQSVTPAKDGRLSFTFTNDNAAPISSIAVSIYAPVPFLQVATIRTDRVTGSIGINQFTASGVSLPVNNADFDRNGVADNVQSGAVRNDGFLLPITLPAVPRATTHNHYVITVPKSLRVWFNPDRTGSAAGVGIRTKSASTVYLEARSEPARGVVQSVQISETYDGTTIEQTIPVTPFLFSGPVTATTGQSATYSSDSAVGNFDSAVGGSLAANGITHSKTTAYANVVWGSTPIDGFVDFRIDSNFVWGLPVLVQ